MFRVKTKTEVSSIRIPRITHARLRAVAGVKRLTVTEAATVALNEWTERESKSAAKELQKLQTA